MNDLAETFGALITIVAKSGATCIYSSYDFRRIIEEGCRVLGYSCFFSEVELPIKIEGEVQFVFGTDIKPIE